MKLLTLNLHCFEEDMIQLNQKRIVDTILLEDIDIVFLQEVAQTIDSKVVNGDIKEDNYGYCLKQELMKRGADYDYYYKIGNQAFGKYDEGIAILSKTELSNRKHFYISKTIDYNQWNTRVIVSAKTVVDDLELVFTSAHFGWSDGYEVFEEQVDSLMNNLSKSDINIIAGDYNISPGTNEYNHIINKGYIDLFYNKEEEYFNIPTHINDIDQKEGSSRIDYVMSNKEFKVINRKILFNEDMVSDHYGVLIEIK